MAKKSSKAKRKQQKQRMEVTYGQKPTEQRMSQGNWQKMETEIAGQRAFRDLHAHPIDRMEFTGVLSSDQASAARDFESLYRAANEIGGMRDSTTIWEPKGHDNGDGNVRAVRDRRELYLFLGMARDQLLRHICVHGNEPHPRQIGDLREALNECARFFKY